VSDWEELVGAKFLLKHAPL